MTIVKEEDKESNKQTKSSYTKIQGLSEGSQKRTLNEPILEKSPFSTFLKNFKKLNHSEEEGKIKIEDKYINCLRR